jgi:cytochrome P450
MFETFVFTYRFFAFGAGRRVCLGETFAKNRLFLFMVTLLQRFTFQPEEGAAAPECDPRRFITSLVMRPEHFLIKAQIRNK